MVRIAARARSMEGASERPVRTEGARVRWVTYSVTVCAVTAYLPPSVPVRKFVRSSGRCFR
jgi:hypothetical protein